MKIRVDPPPPDKRSSRSINIKINKSRTIGVRRGIRHFSCFYTVDWPAYARERDANGTDGEFEIEGLAFVRLRKCLVFKIIYWIRHTIGKLKFSVNGCWRIDGEKKKIH